MLLAAPVSPLVPLAPLASTLIGEGVHVLCVAVDRRSPCVDLSRSVMKPPSWVLKSRLPFSKSLSCNSGQMTVTLVPSGRQNSSLAFFMESSSQN